MNTRTPAPVGLRWLGGPAGAIVAYVVVALSIALSVYVLTLYKDFADCTAKMQARDQERTAILAPYTDHERAADRALLIGPLPGGPDGHTLRQLDLDARAATDRARAAHPAPPAGKCR